jgi:murein DD-endopeptidase MepM/ murein hydrolase activator NlpD
MRASTGSGILRRLLVGVLLATAVSAARTAEAAPCWFPPVAGTVTDPYREPPCTWCAGNRGLDYRVGAGAVVRAAASGRVVFVGTVVDVRYVVIRLADGWRHTYGQLTSTPLQLGDVVVANSVVGAASGTFFFGLRIGDDYADPSRFIGDLRSRPRLIPTDDTAARPAPPARPRCPAPYRRVAPAAAR